MNRTERDKLWEVYGLTREIHGELPHLARKQDITDSIAAHETRLHAPENKKWTRAKTKLIVAITAFITLAGSILAAWKWG